MHLLVVKNLINACLLGGVLQFSFCWQTFLVVRLICSTLRVQELLFEVLVVVFFVFCFVFFFFSFFFFARIGSEVIIVNIKQNI